MAMTPLRVRYTLNSTVRLEPGRTMARKGFSRAPTRWDDIDRLMNLADNNCSTVRQLLASVLQQQRVAAYLDAGRPNGVGADGGLRPVMLSRRSLLAVSAGASVIRALGAELGSREHASESTGLRLQRLAWAGVRLKLTNVTLVIDAIAPDETLGKPGPPLAAGSGRNYALVTHHHDDHCDPKSLAPLLGENGYLLAYEESARFIHSSLVNIQSARLYEPVFLTRGGAEFVVFAVPAADGLGSPQASWVIDGGGRRLIHCGDTLWHGNWWNIARAYGPFDVALLPINGFISVQGQFADEGVPMGMTASEAAAAAHILKAKLTVPIHFGGRNDSEYHQATDAGRKFEIAAQAKGVQVRLLAAGDELIV
jgi:L-ascorbate metabolism protein UlaG (beta-lactamase superfamily)